MPSAPSPDLYREAVSRFATGLTVVSCVVDDVDHAMTASSFVSVSLDPLLVLVSVERSTRFHEAIEHTDLWGVSILSAHAVSHARWFATRGRTLVDQFRDVPHTRGARTGVALVDGALASLEVRTTQRHLAGDHDLLVGEVLTVQLGPADGEPLVYHRRGYRQLGTAAPADSS